MEILNNFADESNLDLPETNQDLLGDFATFEFDFFHVIDNETQFKKNENADVFEIVRQKLLNDVFQENSSFTWTLV